MTTRHTVRNSPRFTGTGPLPEVGDPFGNGFADPAPVRREPKATDKQIAFLVKLMDERNFPYKNETLAKLSKRDASGLIDMILSQPKPKTPATPKAPEITEGMYRNPETDEIFKVQRAVHGSGKLYAKRLVIENVEFGHAATVYFEYAAGAVYKLRPEWKMTLDQAKEFGALYGSCCVCGRTLTDEKSIEAGIGPICASKF